MTDLNHSILIGRLTRDPDNLSYTTSGTARLNFSIAVNRSEKRNGQWSDRVSFFEVTVWGKTAENIRQYLHKGKQIAVDGYLDQQRWEKDGQKYSKVCIIANDVQLLGGHESQDAAQPAAIQQPAGTYSNADGGDFPEDLPF
ncbi:MAG: single-stranded DNA-binding protein [Treponema sp.]|nr:single-stranded DNA-binding protein [Treponema sp.]